MKAWKNIPQITIWFLLWTMLLLNACVQDELCIEEENTDEHTELVIRIVLPNISYSNSSRALDDAKESNVEDITVLLFASDGSLVTKTDARNITEESTGNEVKFSVRVPTGNFDIMIMANCQSLLSGFTPSAPTKTAYRELLLTASGKWNVEILIHLYPCGENRVM